MYRIPDGLVLINSAMSKSLIQMIWDVLLIILMQETINFLTVIDAKIKRSQQQKSTRLQFATLKDRIQVKRNQRYPYAKAIDFRQSMYNQYPKWLTQKDGFSDFMYKSYEKKLMSIPHICEKKIRESDQTYFLSLFLQKISMFQNLPTQIAQIILNNLQTKYYKAGETIYEQNAKQFIGIIYVGSVQYKVGKRVIIKQKNEVFLKQAFQKRRHPTITCRQEAIVLVLDYDVSNLINSKLKNDIEARQGDEIGDLLKSTFFTELHIKDKKAKQFYDDLKIQFYFQDQVIQDAGSDQKAFYMLYKGKILYQNNIFVRQHNKWPLPNNCWQIRAVYNSYHQNQCLKRFDFFGDQQIMENLKFKSKYITSTWTILFKMTGKNFLKNINSQDIKRLKKYRAQHADVSYTDFQADVRAKARSNTQNKKIVLKAINTSLAHKTEFSPRRMALINKYEKSMLSKAFFNDNTIG